MARTYTYLTAERHTRGENVRLESAMAKNNAVEICQRVAELAVQLHGGSGYLADSEVERHFRDARVLSIVGGTTEVLDEMIAGHFR